MQKFLSPTFESLVLEYGENIAMGCSRSHWRFLKPKTVIWFDWIKSLNLHNVTETESIWLDQIAEFRNFVEGLSQLLLFIFLYRRFEFACSLYFWLSQLLLFIFLYRRVVLEIRLETVSSKIFSLKLRSDLIKKSFSD